MCLTHCNNMARDGDELDDWAEGPCGENPGKLQAEIERLRGELKGAYGELIALAAMYNHPTTEKYSRAKLKRVEAAEAKGGERDG